MGVAMGNETTVASRENFTDLARRLYVMPGHFVVYRIGLTSSADEGEFHASVFVSTEYEEHQVPFRFRVAKGSLSTQAHQLSFDTAFPVSRHLTLAVYSFLRCVADQGAHVDIDLSKPFLAWL